jgi:hypothetical protein
VRAQSEADGGMLELQKGVRNGVLNLGKTDRSGHEQVLISSHKTHDRDAMPAKQEELARWRLENVSELRNKVMHHL